MKLFQVCGICQKRKHWFGLTWKTYESFKDSQLLGKNAAEKRLKELTELALCLEGKGAQSREWLTRGNLSVDIIRIEGLRIYPVHNGDYIGEGFKIYLNDDRDGLAPPP